MTHRVGIFYNDSSNLSAGRELDRLAVEAGAQAARDVAAAGRDSGWDVRLLPVKTVADLRSGIGDLDNGSARCRNGPARCRIAFNLIESVDLGSGGSCFEADAADILETAGMPYTGSSSRALRMGMDKALTRKILSEHDIPVPRGEIFECGGSIRRHLSISRLRYPCIVKAAREHASHGISFESVVHDDEEATRRARYLDEIYGQPAVVEEFIEGREFNVAILGDEKCATVLSPAEIDFGEFPAGRPRILTYEAKWVAESPECRGSIPRGIIDSDLDLRRQLETIALKAYHALGLRDYGRIDFRVGESGAHVIDVNPNPDLSENAGLAAAALRSRIDYVELIARIAGFALERAVA